MRKSFPCKKCGLEVRWRRLPSGRYCPENLDHSDHWDICSETAWRNASASVKAARLRKHPPLTTPGIGATLYTGKWPPWAFRRWRWVDPGDEARKREWLAANGYAEPLGGQGGVSGSRARSGRETPWRRLLPRPVPLPPAAAHVIGERFQGLTQDDQPGSTFFSSNGPWTPGCFSTTINYLLGVLTYMSITDDIKARVNAHLGTKLFHLPLLIPGDPAIIRDVIVSEGVRDIAEPPWNERWEGQRHSEFRATLDAFTRGETISVAEDPFDKPGDTFLARVGPVADEIWDIRTVEPGQGIRCLGAFGGKNFFIALTWNYREDIPKPDDWRDEIEECKSQWENLFSPIPRFQGASLDEYLSKYNAV